MAEEGLNGAQVCAVCQEVRGEGVAKGMGGGGFGQAKLAAQELDAGLDNAWRKRAAFLAAEQGIICAKSVRAGLHIGGHRLTDRGQDGDNAYFATLAFDAQAFGQVRVCARKAQGFGDTKACAIEQ